MYVIPQASRARELNLSGGAIRKHPRGMAGPAGAVTIPTEPKRGFKTAPSPKPKLNTEALR